MDCDEFLRGYSDFRDGRHPRPDLRRFEAHREACESCGRYDRVVRRGVRVLRSLPTPSPSTDFVPRLQHRIFHLEDGIPFSDSRVGGSAALAAMAAVGLLALAWLPFALQVPVEVELAPVAVERPADGPLMEASLFGRGPFVLPVLRAADRPDSGADGERWIASFPRQDGARFLGRGPVSLLLTLSPTR